jgi:hypothetical protein
MPTLLFQKAHDNSMDRANNLLNNAGKEIRKVKYLFCDLPVKGAINTEWVQCSVTGTGSRSQVSEAPQ